MSKRYAFDNPGYDSNHSIIGSDRKEKTCGGRRFCVVTVGLILVAILALGLGLGLGLRRKSEEPTFETCRDFDRGFFANRISPNTNGSKWMETDCNLGDKPSCPAGFSKPPLLIISFDGFRTEYLKRNLTPVLQKMANCGVKTDYMRPVYPTKTFPNHYSIVTGLYAESHGIIGNTMVDLELNQIFTLSSPEKNNPLWWKGEPIWVTARKAGKRSATMFWPGSEAKIGGYYPNECYWYDETVPYEMRIDRVLTWLDRPKETRPDVINLYFNEPDSAGHKYGPDSVQVEANISLLDSLLGNLLDGLVERQLHTCIDLIVVADHGMSPVDNKRVVRLADILEGIDGNVFDGAVGRITTKYAIEDGEIERIKDGVPADDIIKRLECTNYNMSMDYYTKVYKKENLPVRMHYSVSPRIEEVIITVGDEWQVKRNDYYVKGGSHGYDNLYPNMHALFVAFGSSFKRTEIEPIENIELYNLMADLLEISPHPNNGTAGRLHQIMRKAPAPPKQPVAGSQYKQSTFPDDVAERKKRRLASDCNCTTGLADVDKTDIRLNLTQSATEAALIRHTGGLTPQLQHTGVDALLLVQENSVRAYSKKHHMPLWAMFTLDDQSGTMFTDFDADCTRQDIRFPSNDTVSCRSYKDDKTQVTAAYLVPPGIGKQSESQGDAKVSSNLVPMYANFKGVWKTILELVAEYQTKYKQVNVALGPVFDNDHNGLVDTDGLEKVQGSDVPLPTHYYIMLTKCDEAGTKLASCPYEMIDVMALLIPHLPEAGNCWDRGDLRKHNYLQTHVARPRDIELITGLYLLRGIKDLDRQMVLRTRVAVGLWDRISWLDEAQCSTLNASSCPNTNGGKDLPMLLISLDGFRADYMKRGVAKVLEKMGKCGVKASFLQSMYPSLTFPNHYSLVTGLYTESHGIVDNNMYDLNIESNFYLGSPNASDPRWWGGEPIWNTVNRNNKTSATFFWPGSDVEIGGGYPTRYEKYDGNSPYSKRIDSVVSWLTGQDGFKADLVVLYMEKVDKYGHEYGPNSPKIDDSIRYVDGYLKDLMDGLKRYNMDKCVNVMVTADHGMADISCDRGVMVGDYLSYEDRGKMHVHLGAAGRISTKYDYYYVHIDPDEQVPTDRIIYNTSCRSERMHVYDMKSLPKRFHYTNNARIGEALFVMEEEWLFNLNKPWCGIKGQHGFDAMTYDTMQALFTSYGPSFKQGYTSAQFENIELYNLISKLLNIDGTANNGTEGSLYHLLVNEPALPESDRYENYTVPQYPTTDAEYNNRTNSSGCSCNPPGGQTVKELDKRLNLDPAQKDSSLNLHLPHGRPRTDGQLALQMLVQNDYVTAYSPELGLPMWVAYTVPKQTNEYDSTNCLRPDVRLEVPDQASCSDYQGQSEYLHNHLFAPGFASSEQATYDAYLLTNSVPMLPHFATGVWRHIVSQAKNWAKISGPLHIITGPAFDHNSDGIADSITALNRTLGRIPIPTHYFIIMLRCSMDKGSCSDMDYDTQAFIVQHRSNVTNCMTGDEYLHDNRARLRDVELLTGLEFLTANKTSAAVRTRIALPRNYGFSGSS